MPRAPSTALARFVPEHMTPQGSLQAELAKVMVRVTIGPSLPITKRHCAKEPVGRLKVVRCCARDSFYACDGA